MVDDAAALLALRTQLRTAVAATTGSTTLVATQQGYTRPAGDFLVDGFVVGMEILPAGFTQNEREIIKWLDADEIKVREAHPAEASGAGRSLTAGLPFEANWEGVGAKPKAGKWFLEEEYAPGPKNQETIGVGNGTMDNRPIYIIKLYAPTGTDSRALHKVAQAIMDVFPPLQTVTLADGTVLRVTSKPAPYKGQVMAHQDSHALIVVTIPLWALTQNII